MVRPEASSFGSRRQSGVPLALERIPDIGGVSKTLDLRRIRRRPGERFAGARPEAEARSAPVRAVPRGDSRSQSKGKRGYAHARASLIVSHEGAIRWRSESRQTAIGEQPCVVLAI